MSNEQRKEKFEEEVNYCPVDYGISAYKEKSVRRAHMAEPLFNLAPTLVRGNSIVASGKLHAVQTPASFCSKTTEPLRELSLHRAIRLIVFLWLAVILWVPISVAQADGIPVPILKERQFVYTVPAGFDPPFIGPSGLREIEKEARKLHFPYYVVIVKDYGGSTTQELSDAVDKLVDVWSNKPKFNRATSSLAVLSYSPRKFRFLAASTWRAKLGLEGQGGQRFVDVFSSYTQGSSKDPKTGIIESMKALDAFVFESTDPKRLALKAQAQRKARAQQQLRENINLLDDQIDRAETLLGQSPQFLPPDTSGPERALVAARAARNSESPTKILSTRRDLEAKSNVLDAFIDEKRRSYQAQIATQERARQAALDARGDQERRQRLEALERKALLLGALLVLCSLVFWQWRRLKAVSTLFRAKTTAWEEALLNAANNHTRFFEERQNVTELSATSGRTREKYDEVTHEVGAIYPTIEAMRERIAQCKQVFGQGSFLRVKPLQQALALLDAEFEFDTQSMNRKSLFEPPVRIIKIQPTDLREQLQRQYADNIADWDELMQALQLREIIAQDAFPSTDLTQMLDLASQKGVPHRWLSSHPLFGDDESDGRFYDELNTLRVPDPLAYKQRLEDALQIENGLKAVLARLIAALDLIEAKRVRVLPAHGETVVAASDDPTQTLVLAFQADERLSGFLASKTLVKEVEDQANLAAGLYQSALEQAATLQAAIEGAEGDTHSLGAQLDAMRLLQSQTQERLQKAQNAHAETGAAATSMERGQHAVTLTSRLLQDARRLLEEKRHLEARHEVQQANQHLASAEHDFGQCVHFCEDLDAQKRTYELQLASLASARTAAEASLRRYGQDQRFSDFHVLPISGPANYGLLMLQITEYQQQIEEEVRRARRVYEEEQARLEREREAQRQRKRDEERRRNSTSLSSSASRSSSSSSSGSSWSGRSSSSSGTDW